MFHFTRRFTRMLGVAALGLTIAGCTPSQPGASTSKTVPTPGETNVVDTNVSPSSQTMPVPGGNNVVDTSVEPSDDLTATEGVKTFTVEGKNFAFFPATIKVKKGDTVKIVFKNTEGFHDWVIDEFYAATQRMAAGASTEVQFVANKTGTFEYYCSVGNHRAMGMKGNLIVE